MWRHASRPRENWQSIVEREGLVYALTEHADGNKAPYWNEAAWYEFTMPEIEAIEAATEELWRMCTEAVVYMFDNYDDKRLGLPEGSMAYARKSWDREDPSVYARFDLNYTPSGEIKMLEINGDTPTGLIETAVAQWTWVEQVLPGTDQFNSLHDRLVERWRELKNRGHFPDNIVHFFWDGLEPSGEEELTVHYMRDTAERAGLACFGQPISAVQWHTRDRYFHDAMGVPIKSAFKLYPWEVMLDQEFGQLLLDGAEKTPVKWFEPAWKLLMSTKGILPVLWELYPGHELLLPSYWDEPHDLTDWVSKPLQGREGDNITIHIEGEEDQVMKGEYGEEGFVYQQWCPLPSFDGNRTVIGSWIVDGQAAGMLCRESDGPITDYFSRVVPHAISDALAPDQAQVQQWLRERVPAAAP